MNCNQVREQMLDGMAAGVLADGAASHLGECAECARLWSALKSVDGALDAWPAPEVSPYFATRLRARLDEVKAEEARRSSWSGLLHSSTLRLAATGVLAVAVAVGVDQWTKPSRFAPPQSVSVQAASAVNDLQNLEKNQDLYSDLDLLDDLAAPAKSAAKAPGAKL